MEPSRVDIRIQPFPQPACCIEQILPRLKAERKWMLNRWKDEWWEAPGDGKVREREL